MTTPHQIARGHAMQPPANRLDSTPWTSWATAYHDYRSLEMRYRQGGNPSHNTAAHLVRAVFKGPRAFPMHVEKVRQVGEEKGFYVPLELVETLTQFSSLLSTYDTEEPDFVFDDVYHAAFHHAVSWSRYNNGPPVKPSRVYRGQRDASWGIGAKIYRDLGKPRDAALQESVSKACRLGAELARRYNLTFDDAMAIAQHYSAEAEVPTWMLDFSFSPWVGLFFASNGGVTGEVGVVWSIFVSEFDERSSGGANSLGQLKLVTPVDCQRITNQQGVFITAGQPALIDQMVPPGYETRFHQHEGLVFEDPALGITRTTICPEDDPWLPRIKEVSGHLDGVPGSRPESLLQHAPRAVWTDPLDPATYQDVLESWLAAYHAPDATAAARARAVLPTLAAFQATLNSPGYRDRLSTPVARSFARLSSALRTAYWIARKQERDLGIEDVDECVRQAYMNQVYFWDDDVSVLREAWRTVAVVGLR